VRVGAHGPRLAGGDLRLRHVTGSSGASAGQGCHGGEFPGWGHCRQVGFKRAAPSPPGPTDRHGVSYKAFLRGEQACRDVIGACRNVCQGGVICKLILKPGVATQEPISEPACSASKQAWTSENLYRQAGQCPPAAAGWMLDAIAEAGGRVAEGRGRVAAGRRDTWMARRISARWIDHPISN
jgi:hypothetical protein